MTNESSNDLKGLAAFAGNAPNEIWSRTGQFLAAISSLSILGIGIGGMEMGETTQYAPWVMLLAAFFCLYYGTRLRKNGQIASRLHELEMADKRTDGHPKPEPTRGHKEFLEFIKPKLPITIAEIRELDFKYDAARTKKMLLIASNYQRIGFWENDGTLKKYGDVYDLRDKPTSDETIYDSNS